MSKFIRKTKENKAKPIQQSNPRRWRVSDHRRELKSRKRAARKRNEDNTQSSPNTTEGSSRRPRNWPGFKQRLPNSAVSITANSRQGSLHCYPHTNNAQFADTLHPQHNKPSWVSSTAKRASRKACAWLCHPLLDRNRLQKVLEDELVHL